MPRVGENQNDEFNREQFEDERVFHYKKTGKFIDEFETTDSSRILALCPPLWRIKLDGRPAWMSEEACKEIYGVVYDRFGKVVGH